MECTGCPRRLYNTPQDMGLWPRDRKLLPVLCFPFGPQNRRLFSAAVLFCQTQQPTNNVHKSHVHEKKRTSGARPVNIGQHHWHLPDDTSRPLPCGTHNNQARLEEKEEKKTGAPEKAREPLASTSSFWSLPRAAAAVHEYSGLLQRTTEGNRHAQASSPRI